MSAIGDNNDPEPGFPTAADAEQAFYAAFAACDLAAMSRVWGSDEIICIHPGATPLLGREAVLDSWSRILGGGSSPRIRITLRSSKASADLAVHLVEEFISEQAVSEGAIVLATNVYIRRDSGWYLFEHHASSPQLRRARGGSGPAGRSKQTLQ